jgi:hypothetical protein
MPKKSYLKERREGKIAHKTPPSGPVMGNFPMIRAKNYEHIGLKDVRRIFCSG